MLKLKSAILILGLIGMGSKAALAQSPFKSLPRVEATRAQFYPKLALATKDSSVYAWRPIANIAAYAEPGNLLMAGVGFGYQKLTWNTTTQKWVSDWSVSGVAFAGGSTAPSSPATVMSVGVLGGVLNNLFMLGPIYNFGTKQFGVAVSVGINLNN